MASPDEPEPQSDWQLARLVFALSAALLLVLLALFITPGGDSDGVDGSVDACIDAWNSSRSTTRTTGEHAYNGHGYRQIFVSRVSRDAEPLGSGSSSDAGPADAPDSRCTVAFAAPQNDEPGFGVFIFQRGDWENIVLTDKLTYDEVAARQRDALPVANATVQADGTLRAN